MNPTLEDTGSVVVKDVRLKDKDKDKDLMSKDEDKDGDSASRTRTRTRTWAGINTHISCRQYRARSHVISCVLSLSCHR